MQNPLNPFQLNHVTYHSKYLLPNQSGIYYVLNLQTHNLLYVGKAKNIRQRWQSHHRTEDVWLLVERFSSYMICIAWELRPAQNLEAAERRRIRALQPLLNGKNSDESMRIILQELARC